MSDPEIAAHIEQCVRETQQMIAAERVKRGDNPGFLEWLDMLDAELAKFGSHRIAAKIAAASLHQMEQQFEEAMEWQPNRDGSEARHLDD